MRDTRSAALVLLGHGTVLNPDSCLPVLRQAEALRASGLFAEVHAAFWKQEPKIQQVLDSIVASEIYIVPMFISEGYFSEKVIPAELGFAGVNRTLTSNGRSIHYTRAVGTHPEMTRVLLERAEEVVRRFPTPLMPSPTQTTLLIAGHGTGRDERSRLAVEEQTRIIQEMGTYAAVRAIFMEEAPFIRNWREHTETPYAVVVPFFISDGLHVTEDIPVMLGEPDAEVKQRIAQGQPPWRNPTERSGVLVWYASSVGTSPVVTDVIVARVQQAAEAHA